MESEALGAKRAAKTISGLVLLENPHFSGRYLASEIQAEVCRSFVKWYFLLGGLLAHVAGLALDSRLYFFSGAGDI